VEIQLFNNTGATFTPAADTAYVRIEAALVFRDTAYESGNASVLKADTLVKDARDQATALLSSSNDRIEAQTFSIPEFHMDGQRTPREVINAANAYEDCQAAVDVYKRLVFREKPTTPLFEIGNWTGAEMEDATVVVDPAAPDRTLALGLRLLLDESSRLGDGRIRLLTRRDVRGLAFVEPIGVTLPAPFVDGNADGLADADGFGRFVDATGAPIEPTVTPFRLLGKTVRAAVDLVLAVVLLPIRLPARMLRAIGLFSRA
jgi:hypothetical protein